MRVGFNGSITETENCKGVWLNVIDVELANGIVVTLDRDTTWYAVNENDLSMEWDNAYIWNGEYENYNITSGMFDGARLISVEVEDDADEGYDIRISDIEFFD